MTAVTRQDVSLGNGQSIVATIYRPDKPPKAVVVVASAMGVSQRYYAPFAEWLAAQGYAAVTFDYLGIGLSRNGDLRALDVNIVDWACRDCNAMVDMAAALAPDRPLYWVGHSLGGQVLGFLSDPGRITKAVIVASGSGYWRENSPSTKWKAWWLWHVVAPAVTRLWGYFPGKRLRKVGDLPRGVMEQWRRWCLDPDYALGAEGETARARFAAVAVPIMLLSFADDEMMSLRNTVSLHDFYKGAPRAMKRISPQDIGAARIGHFGFFRERFQDTLWKGHLLPELS